jgi:hypothetical protein
MTDLDGEAIELGGGQVIFAGDTAWVNADRARQLVALGRVRYVEQRVNGSSASWGALSAPNRDGNVWIERPAAAAGGVALGAGESLEPGKPKCVPAAVARHIVLSGRARYIRPPTETRR